MSLVLTQNLDVCIGCRMSVGILCFRRHWVSSLVMMYDFVASCVVKLRCLDGPFLLFAKGSLTWFCDLGMFFAG